MTKFELLKDLLIEFSQKTVLLSSLGKERNNVLVPGTEDLHSLGAAAG